jgi:adenylate cyclase
MMFGFGNFTFFLLFVALAALSYSPWQPIWAGVVAGVVWYGAYFRVNSLPDSIAWPFDELPEPDTLWAFITQPYFVNDSAMATEALAALTIGAVLAAVVWRSRRLVARQMEASRQRANLARYFAPTLVDRLAEHDEVLRTARTQQVAVLFADIVGFTGRAERSDPQAVVELLRDFHRGMEAAVFEHDGTLDKFLGDGVMATFGSPERGPRDAINALAAARAMLDSVEALNAARALDPPLRIGVGLHYGEVVLGDIGSERRLEYAVLGDVVNVAARLEEMTRRLECRLAVSQATLEAAASEDAAAFAGLDTGLRAAGEQELRGRDERIAVSVLD